MYAPTDTIVAIATPPGRGGLGVIRISGERALEIARSLIQGGQALEARRATLVRVITSTGGGTPIDEAIATFFPAGGSYTGDDLVEVSLHGSPIVLSEVVEAVVGFGARLAQRGEFTLRAFLNGRIDLTRAEAVQDLVDATTPRQARAAFDQLNGTLAERIGEIEGQLFDLVARLEASEDFPDEGYHFVSAGEAQECIAAAARRIDTILADSRRGRLLREGVSVAILGRPNVGKSTLFNRLSGADRAIVTPVPGTTRDVITESVMLLGTRMLLADTAGLRTTSDPVEREGVARAEKAGAAADVAIVVLDASEPLRAEDLAVLRSTSGRPRVVWANKWDRVSADERERVVTALDSALTPGEEGGGIHSTAVVGSAKSGDGVDRLVETVGVVAGLGHPTEHVLVTNVRHIGLLRSAREALGRALAWRGDFGQIPEEAILSDLLDAMEALQEVSGKRTKEELLDAIFSRFCIGK